MAKGDRKDKGALRKLRGRQRREGFLLCRGTLSQSHSARRSVPVSPSPVSKGSRLCLFVMHSTAVHKQIDINLCQPFLFKTMNYSRNITILIRNH